MITRPLDSPGAFHDALHELAQEAHEQGLDVEGAWPLRNGDTVPDWEVEFSELAKRSSARSRPSDD